VEIAPERPWLTVAETNRLIRQQGLSLAVAQAWVLDEIVGTIELSAEEEKQLIRRYVESQGVNSDEELAAWLPRKRLGFEDLRYFATKGRRLERWLMRRYREEAELRFLERKLDLDQVVYALLRVSDRGLAEELHQRIQEGEADFAALAEHHSQGSERQTRGQLGPLPLTAGHPELVARLHGEGRLRIRAASYKGLVPSQGEVTIRLRHRGEQDVVQVSGAALINSSGIEYDWRRVARPLPRQLLKRGLIQPGPLALGIAADVSGAVLDAHGNVSRRLFAMGPPLRGMWWESTAVTDVAIQAKALAARLAHL